MNGAVHRMSDHMITFRSSKCKVNNHDDGAHHWKGPDINVVCDCECHNRQMEEEFARPPSNLDAEQLQNQDLD